GLRILRLEGLAEEVAGKRRERPRNRATSARLKLVRIRERSLPLDRNRFGVRRGYPIHEADRWPAARAQSRRAEHFEREDEIIRRERLPVVPGDAGLQMIGRLHPTVGRDAPGV